MCEAVAKLGVGRREYLYSRKGLSVKWCPYLICGSFLQRGGACGAAPQRRSASVCVRVVCGVSSLPSAALPASLPTRVGRGFGYFNNKCIEHTVKHTVQS